MKVFLIEINYNDARTYNPSAESTLYFSTVPFRAFSISDSLRPNVYYEPRILDIGSIPRYMYGSGMTYGRTSVGGGEITIDNSDGAYDVLMYYSFDGRDISIYYGDTDAAFSTFEKILVGTAETPSFIYSKTQSCQIKIPIRDKWALLEKPISTNFYSGTNTGTTGNEGAENDIKGKSKPLAFGRCQNIKGAMVNSSGLRWQVHDGEVTEFLGCFINGVAQTLVTGVPAPGQYAVDLTTSIATLGSAPAGDEVTFDVRGAKLYGFYENKVAYLINSIIKLYGGLSTGFNGQDITDLIAINSMTCGYYVDVGSTENVSSVIDNIANMIGAYAFFDKVGELRMGLITDPSTLTSVKTFAQVGYYDVGYYDGISNLIVDFDEFEIVQSVDENKGVPIKKCIVKYAKNYTVQTKVAGAVSLDRQAWLKLETRDAVATQPSIASVYRLAPTLTRETNVAFYTDAIALANSIISLYAVNRIFIKIVVDYEQNKEIDIGMCVTLKMKRFGLDAGKKMIVIGVIAFAPLMSKMTLELWG